MSYSRVCEEYRNEVLVRKFDCREMSIQINKFNEFRQGSNYEKNFWEEVIAELNFRDFIKPPVLGSIRTYSDAPRAVLSIVDEGIESTGASKIGTIINEAFGRWFLNNNDVEVSWDEVCAKSKLPCTLINQNYSDSFKTRPNPPCDKEWVACSASIDRLSSSQSTVSKIPLNNSYEVRSAISYREIHKDMNTIEETIEKKVKTIFSFQSGK